MKHSIIDRINQLARDEETFLFVVNYTGTEAYIRKLKDIDPAECLYDIGGVSNDKALAPAASAELKTWSVKAPPYEEYRRGFDTVRRNILVGNSYLANFTCQAAVDCNLSLRDIFLKSKSSYRLLLNSEDCRHGRFVCFSPETFIRIKEGRIFSYPMKGTIDASIPDARRILKEDGKEAAEHATIVDLIRNDLSRVASDVRVDRYRYMDMLHTNHGDIIQTSSEISGLLPDDYRNHIGDILAAQLPAGSITGAPKDKTLQIICEAETYERGFYTGIMGIYDKGNIDSAVMIRFVEEEEDAGLTFKAGGGITSQSVCRREYEEAIQKMYLPFK